MQSARRTAEDGGWWHTQSHNGAAGTGEAGWQAAGEKTQKKISGVCFDTNMLLAIQQFGIDVFAEVKKMFGAKIALVAPEQVLWELAALEKKGLKMRKAVAVAKIALEKNNVKKISFAAAGAADEALMGLARQGWVVATNDSALRKKIKGFGGAIIYIRQRKFIVGG
ncbi:MAG: hypothetical protein NTW59_01630 [Candidatus Diapherotrites archaeon]|nr:hypothetical protein [Candidatus Diapherotrites archaeon]